MKKIIGISHGEGAQQLQSTAGIKTLTLENVKSNAPFV